MTESNDYDCVTNWRENDWELAYNIFLQKSPLTILNEELQNFAWV
jgi:hypothetical protein